MKLEADDIKNINKKLIKLTNLKFNLLNNLKYVK
jgi:hypothetical protein